MKFIELFTFYSKFVRRRQFIILSLSIFATFLETLGFLTLAPLLSYTGSEMPENESGAINILMDIFKFDPKMENILIFLVTAFVLKGIILWGMLKYLGDTRANLLFSLRQKLLILFGQSVLITNNEISHGEQVNIFSKQTECVAQLYFSLISVLTLLTSAIVFGVVSFVMSPLVTLCGLVTGLFYWFLMNKVNILVSDVSNKRSVQESDLVQESYQFVSGFEYFKSTNRVKAIQNRLLQIYKKIKILDYSMSTLQSFSQAFREPVLVCVLALMIFLSYQATSGGVGELLVSLLLMFKALGALMGVQSSYAAALSNSGSLTLYTKELERLEKIIENSGNTLFDFKSEIKFENVSYQYPGTKNLILENVSFSIKKGEKIAITGVSGSGKSTLLRLILLHIIPTAGVVYIDGINSKNYNKKSFRNKIGFVPQKLNVISGSILENISLGRSNSKDALSLCREFLKIVSLNDLSKDKSYLTDRSVLGSDTKLSGGQIQRLCVARELYGDAEIYLLDEASSALDDDTQTKLKNSLNHYLKDKTIIFVTHRENFISEVDKLIELSNGTAKTSIKS
tara:strand:+ start:12753 stop:14456 length:1704 start_codon:yes stop_codon:yes gene_type:complete